MGSVNAFSEIKTVKRPPTLFLSYSSQDKEFAQQLASDLTNNEVDVWIDFWEIKVGDSIIDKISTAIQENDFIGVILTPASCNSVWVRKEASDWCNKGIRRKKGCSSSFVG